MLSPSLPLGSPIWTMGELVVTLGGSISCGQSLGHCFPSPPPRHHIHDLNSPPPPPPPPPSPLHHPLPLHDNEGLIQEYWHPYREGPNVQPFIDNLGGMNVHCPDCGALHWLREKLSKSSNHNPCFGSCCLQGKVQLPIPHPPPSLLQHLSTVHSN